MIPIWQALGFPNKQQYIRAANAQNVRPDARVIEKPGDGEQPTYYPGWVYEADLTKRMLAPDERPDGTRKPRMGRPPVERTPEEQRYLDRKLLTPRRLYEEGMVENESDAWEGWYGTLGLDFILRRRLNGAPTEYRIGQRMWELLQPEWTFDATASEWHRTGRAFPFWRGQSKRDAQDWLYDLRVEMNPLAPIPVEYRNVKDASTPKVIPALYAEYKPWWIPGIPRSERDLTKTLWTETFGYREAMTPGKGACADEFLHARGPAWEKPATCPGCRAARNYRNSRCTEEPAHADNPFTEKPLDCVGCIRAVQWRKYGDGPVPRTGPLYTIDYSAT